MAAQKSQQGTYARSDLLTQDENKIVEQMYAPKREVLAVSVAQLFHAAPNPRVWTKQQTGVIALIKDHNQRSYFLHFINIDTHSTTYSEELYLELEYKTPYSYFHTFAGERCTVGLNFCSDVDANNFKMAIQGITIRNKKRKEKVEAANRPPPATVVQSMPPAPMPVVPAPEVKLTKAEKKKKEKEEKKRKKKGITKADISGPSNFEHRSHLGWDPDKNQFDESKIHPALKDLLDTAGIKTTALKDEGTAEFIKSFVENHGGMDTLVKEKNRRATMRAAPAHGRGPPPAPPGGTHAAAPPPPSRTPAPAAPTRQTQPPPPVQRQQRGPPPPPTSGRAPRGAAPPPPPPPAAPRAPPAPAAPPAPKAPPAPRAPPAPAAPKAPPAPALGKVAPSAPAPQAGRGNLLDEIRQGKQLKSSNEPAPTSGGGGGGGGGLLDEIRNFGGAKGGLKSSATRQPSAEAPPDDPLEGMAGALARALAGRNKVLAVDSGSEEESDDDWSD